MLSGAGTWELLALVGWFRQEQPLILARRVERFLRERIAAFTVARSSKTAEFAANAAFAEGAAALLARSNLERSRFNKAPKRFCRRGSIEFWNETAAPATAKSFSSRGLRFVLLSRNSIRCSKNPNFGVRLPRKCLNNRVAAEAGVPKLGEFAPFPLFIPFHFLPSVTRHQSGQRTQRSPQNGAAFFNRPTSLVSNCQTTWAKLSALGRPCHPSRSRGPISTIIFGHRARPKKKA